MKTSFYFVIWFVVYRFLALFDSVWIDRNSFLVALVLVWALSWFLNRSMPHILSYGRLTENAPILNDIYSGNVTAFKNRLNRISIINFIWAVYFGVSLIFSLLVMNSYGSSGLIGIFIFGLLAIGSLMKASRLRKYLYRLHQTPTPEECAKTAAAMGLNYDAYYDMRRSLAGNALLPPPPPHFGAFEIFSLIAAVICCVFGLYYIVVLITGVSVAPNFSISTSVIMYFLYASLSLYYGVRDCISSVNYFRIAKAN